MCLVSESQYFAQEQETLTLTCSGSSSEESEIAWYDGNSSITTGVTTSSDTETTQTSTLTIVSPTDDVTYTCKLLPSNIEATIGVDVFSKFLSVSFEALIFTELSSNENVKSNHILLPQL